MCFLSILILVKAEELNSDVSGNLKGVLSCLRREYTLKATRTDRDGRQCWDIIRAISCWGRCDSFEIPDWRFPYKISVHPVCMHERRKLRRVELRNCDPGADEELRFYEYYDAESCSCGVCNSSDTFCDWKGRISVHHHPKHHEHHTKNPEHSKHHEHPRNHQHPKHHETLELIDGPEESFYLK
nr:thyrostimulin beta-5 subunit-like [Parasteatoda tepidariorum]